MCAKHNLEYATAMLMQQSHSDGVAPSVAPESEVGSVSGSGPTKAISDIDASALRKIIAHGLIY
jgi:hypothetical protein